MQPENSGLAIFLHFLNREAFRAADVAYDPAQIIKAIRILSIARTDELFTNYANLSEGGLLSVSARLVRYLLQHHALLIEGERPTFDEFLDSRAGRYGFDQARYPMYFSGRSQAGLVPWRVRSVSLTDHIAGEVIAVDEHEKGLAQLQLLPIDVPTLKEVLPEVARIVRGRGERAITRSLFESQNLASSARGAASRLLATSYIRRHLADLDAAIATGFAGLGVFDHLGKAGWGCDLRLLDRLLVKTGLAWHTAPTEETDEALSAARSSREQALFSDELLLACRALELSFGGVPYHHRIAQVSTLLASLDGPRKVQVATSSNESLVQAYVSMRQMVNQLRSTNLRFAAMQELALQEKSQRTLLLVTATKVETQALAEAIKLYAPIPQGASYIQRDQYIVADHGVVNNIRILSVQCEAGSVGTANAQAVVSDAIRDFAPQWVIMGGIAFGTQPQKQKLGDLLIAKQLVEYEKAKIKDGKELARGPRKESSPKLLSAFRAAEAGNLTATSVHVGLLLSGEKLADDPDFIEARLRLEPEAIGGEMEGAGLAASADRSGVPWIVVKAIVDWGRGKDRNNSEEEQRSCALNAFSFIVRTVVEVGL
jgi:nucleoside phosphorylase